MSGQKYSTAMYLGDTLIKPIFGNNFVGANPFTPTITIEYLVVGGGGACRSTSSGGGGAGQFISGSTNLFFSIPIPISAVGTGGIPDTNATSSLGQGGDTTFNGITAVGGGFGGFASIEPSVGGSGGGSRGAAGALGASGSAGFPGGDSPWTGSNGGRGGGGGASQKGGDSKPFIFVPESGGDGGDGGDGLQWVDGIYYCGGGGGAPYSFGDLITGSIGLGGGSGSFGGGGHVAPVDSGLTGNGGPGVVKIRYSSSAVPSGSITGGNSIITSGSFIYHTFTSTGTLNWVTQ
jgi:hypothetical protein